MRYWIGWFILLISLLFLTSLFVPSIASRVDLFRQGVFSYNLRDAREAPPYGFVAVYSVWQSGKLIGHVLSGGNYVPLSKGQIGATDDVDFFVLRLVLGISTLAVALVLLTGRLKTRSP